MFRRAGRTLSDEDRLYNRDQAGLRIKVEHAIGRIKLWRAMRDHRRPPTRFNETGRAIATLVSILS